MVKTIAASQPATDKGGQTRRHIFRCALELFRVQGFEATTMKQIAVKAGVAKGAAYYYFPGKEALIQAYYETIQTEQERICAEVFAEEESLKERLMVAMHSKLDLAKDDRKLLGVVFRYTGEPGHPLSCLGKRTAPMRRRATQVFRDAMDGVKLPKDLKILLPVALWAMQMGLLVMFLYDESKGQVRTRRLATGALTLTLKLLVLAKLPVLKPVRVKVLGLLTEAGLVEG